MKYISSFEVRMSTVDIHVSEGLSTSQHMEYEDKLPKGIIDITPDGNFLRREIRDIRIKIDHRYFTLATAYQQINQILNEILA